jgi:hypothetical protein
VGADEHVTAGSQHFREELHPLSATRPVNGVTDSFGLVVFEVNKARKGLYTLTIDDVVEADHPFDVENSVLSASIFKKK